METPQLVDKNSSVIDVARNIGGYFSGGYFPGVTLFIKMTYTWKLRSVSLQVYGRVGISLVEVDLKYMKG